MRRIWMFLILVGLLVVWLVAAGTIVGGDAHSPSPASMPVLPPIANPQSELVVTPMALGAEVPVDEQEVQNLFIGNAGTTATLVYTIAVLPFAQVEGIVDWLEVTPTQGTVHPTSQVTVDVTFDATGKEAGFLESASLRIDSNSLVTPTVVTVPVILQVIEATRVLVVTPTSLSAELPLGATAWQTLTVGNEGNATMEFALIVPSEPPTIVVPWVGVSPVTGTVPPGEGEIVMVTFDAAGLGAGFYTSPLIVESNSQSIPSVTVSLSLTAEPAFVYLPAIFKQH